MELHEAITHASEVSRRDDVCETCRVEHSKLASWLEELYQLKAFLGNKYDIGRLRDLVQADRDGRCVVLKFAPGSTVYRTWVHPGNGKTFITEHYMDSVKSCIEAELWNNAYSTKEAAEQALKEVEKDG